MVDRADCLVAFFNTKIGSSTARAKTGTIEEIERALERGIPVHLFTSSKGFPREISPEQIEALNETIEHYRRLGIVGQYNTIESLRSDLYSVFDADIAAIASRIPEPFDSNQLLCWLLESHSAPTAPTTPILRIENTGDDDVYLKRVVVIGNDGTVIEDRKSVV